MSDSIILGTGYDIFFEMWYSLNIGKKLKGHDQAKINKNRWFYFGFLIWSYDVNMSID